MCGMYKQSRSCQLPFCASPIFHFEIGDFPFTCLLTFCGQQCDRIFHCMFTLFFVVVRKRYCLPTSYQNISLIPTCLQSFIHLSI